MVGRLWQQPLQFDLRRVGAATITGALTAYPDSAASEL